MTTMPLLNPDESEKSRLSSWLLVNRDLAVVVCFVHDTYDEKEGDGPENGEDPVCPRPGGFPCYETSNEGAEIRGDDNEA